MGRVFAVSVAVILATTLIVVDARTRAHDTRMEVQRASIEQMLNASLSIGDGPQQIETALKQSALSFVYMKDQQRYHASVGTDDPNTWVEATIAVSAEQRVIDVSVRTRFVSL